MSKPETLLQNQILREYGRLPDVTLWRQNVGTARTEAATRAHLERLLSMLTVNDWDNARGLLRSLLAEKPRFTRYGLAVGSSDIVGIVDSGTRGIFLTLEVKTARGVVSKEQEQWMAIVNRRHGVARVVRSVAEAGAAIEEARAL